MKRIDEVIEVRCPVSTVYNQWTQFEEFPHFMRGVEEVRQLDDTHVHWRATVWGRTKEWDAEITEQIPDQVVAWRSIDGPMNGGEVRFVPLGPDRTRMHLAMFYEPEGAMENIGDALNVLKRQVHKTAEDFKSFIESRGAETGEWRGEVHGGRATQTPDDGGIGGAPGGGTRRGGPTGGF